MALPVFLIAMLCIAGSDHLFATILQEPVRIAPVVLRTAGQPVVWQGNAGIAVALEERSSATVDASAARVTVSAGSAIVATSGFVDIVADSSVVRVLHGSVLVLRDATSVTAVALTSPLLVESAGSSTLLPRGYQMRMEGGKMSTSEVPLHWLQEKMRLIPVVTDAGLSQSATEAVQLLGISRCTSLPAPLAAIDASAVMAEFLTTADATVDCSDALLRLMPSDATPSRILLLFALLSQRRNAANLLAELDVPVTMDSSFVLAVVQEQTALSRPLPLSVLDTLTHSAERAATMDPQMAGEMLLDKIDGMALALDTAGYPESARQWQRVSSRLHDFIAPLLPPAAKHQESDVLPVAAARTYEPAKIVSLARQYLQSSALLFTEKTTIVYETKARVRFEHAYIATAHGDSDISGTFDTETQQVSSIVLGAIPLPNQVSLSALAQSL